MKSALALGRPASLAAALARLEPVSIGCLTMLGLAEAVGEAFLLFLSSAIASESSFRRISSASIVSAMVLILSARSITSARLGMSSPTLTRSRSWLAALRRVSGTDRMVFFTLLSAR